RMMDTNGTFFGPALASAERYVPGTGWVGAPNLLVTRRDQAATVLSDGRVVFSGGSSNSGFTGQASQTIEFYESPSSGTAPSIANPNMPNGSLNVPYPTAAAPDVTLVGVGGTGPYTFTVVSGALPTGLQLTAGKITGTPTAQGTFNVGVRVTDAN